jgi:hypothetical protein
MERVCIGSTVGYSLLPVSVTVPVCVFSFATTKIPFMLSDIKTKNLRELKIKYITLLNLMTYNNELT